MTCLLQYEGRSNLLSPATLRYAFVRKSGVVDFEVGGTSSPSGIRGQSPCGGFGGLGQSSPKAPSILRIFGWQTMHNFVYLAKLRKPLVKHEKNL